jgi:hypothetical protein
MIATTMIMEMVNVPYDQLLGIELGSQIMGAGGAREF